MDKILITRKQFEQIREIFDNYDVDSICWKEESPSGIGPTITAEFESKDQTLKVDLTDVTTW